VPYEGGDWYEQTAGVLALPAERQLTAAELAQIGGSELKLESADGKASIVEAPLYVRADALVYRFDPGESANVELYASRLGEPFEGATIELVADPSQLQPEPDIPVGTPPDAVRFPGSVVTGAGGIAEVQLEASDPNVPAGPPRRGIDGQVYGVRAKLAEDPGFPADQWNFVSVLVWGGFQPDDPPTWNGSLEPIFQQYANLYPIMGDVLDLSSYADVCANRKLLLLAFELDPADPNSMPVTRDLSSAKRAAILAWLNNLGPDGKPLLGVPNAAAPAQAEAAATAERPALDLSRGGKAAAAARRLILQGEDR
jgi:hypothetical protein